LVLRSWGNMGMNEEGKKRKQEKKKKFKYVGHRPKIPPTKRNDVRPVH
jgi:hypothetical protein